MIFFRRTFTNFQPENSNSSSEMNESPESVFSEDSFGFPEPSNKRKKTSTSTSVQNTIKSIEEVQNKKLKIFEKLVSRPETSDIYLLLECSEKSN